MRSALPASASSRGSRRVARAAGFFGVGLGVETEERDKTARTGQDGEGEERGEFVAGVRGRGRREGGGAERPEEGGARGDWERNASRALSL